MEPLHRMGMEVLFYLEDLHFASSLQATLQTVKLVSHLSRLHNILEKELFPSLSAHHLSGGGSELSHTESMALAGKCGHTDSSFPHWTAQGKFNPYIYICGI